MKIPGRIVGDRLIKSVVRSKHFLRCVQGYAWSREQLTSAMARGVKVLEIQEDSGRVLRVSADYAMQKGKRFQFGNFEPQIGVPETAMTTKDPNQGELF